MATSLASLVTCDVCFELFTEPKSLVCRHILCSPCVDKIKRGNKVECPMCKRKSNLNDIEPDFRTSILVETYKTQGKSVHDQTKHIKHVDTRKYCEFCLSEEPPIICKCEQCHKLMCKACKVSHQENASNLNHTVKSIVSLAAEAKTALSKLGDQIKEKQAFYHRNQEQVTNSMEDCNLSVKDALSLIDQKESALHDVIKTHHDTLRKKVHEHNEIMRNTCKKVISESDCGILDIQGKLHVICDLVDNADDITLADIGDDMVKKIEKELSDADEIPTEFKEDFAIEVLDGPDFNESDSTKLSITPGLNIAHDEGETIIQKDYSQIAEYDFMLEKEIKLPEYTWVQSMFLFQNKLYCITDNNIHIYDKEIKLEKSTTLELVSDAKAVLPASGEYYVTACSTTGLHVHSKEGKHLQRISTGSFVSVFLLSDKLHAFECEKKELIIYTQASCTWKKTKSIKYSIEDLNSDCRVLSLSDKIFISKYDGLSDCIYKCDLSGKILNTFGSCEQLETVEEKQPVSGKLSGPYVCCSDSMGNVIVADSGNDRLQLCTASGDWGIISLRGQSDVKCIRFAAVSDDGKSIWLTDQNDENSLKIYKATTLPYLNFN